jgi:hypothetical protein
MPCDGEFLQAFWRLSNLFCPASREALFERLRHNKKARLVNRSGLPWDE